MNFFGGMQGAANCQSRCLAFLFDVLGHGAVGVACSLEITIM